MTATPADLPVVAYSYVTCTNDLAREEFHAAMRTRSRAVERFPGFQRFEFRKEAGRGGRFVIATWWRSRSDLRAWMQSPEHAATHTRLSDVACAGIEPPRVEVHEVLEVSG